MLLFYLQTTSDIKRGIPELTRYQNTIIIQKQILDIYKTIQFSLIDRNIKY